MTAVSLLVINYRSAALALDAIRSARAATSRPLQVVVVDNSPAEEESLRSAADHVLTPPRNLGYAGGINAGRRLCDGDTIVVCNPDVVFERAAIDRLLDVDAAVAGPALFWDGAFEWLLPPSELHTTREVLGRALASRSRGWTRRRDRRRFLQRVAFWSLREPARVAALSGAVMAIRAKAFDDAGGFDARFPLYFEENDFLRRVHGEVVYVPAARCRHVYNQSAAGSPEAAAKYAQSEREYLKKWGGSWAKRLERAGVIIASASQSAARGGEIVTEASPLASFDTAAGHFGEADVPEDVWSSYRGDVLHLRAVDRASGAVLRTWAKIRQ